MFKAKDALSSFDNLRPVILIETTYQQGTETLPNLMKQKFQFGHICHYIRVS